jgi:hypothetical protein
VRHGHRAKDGRSAERRPGDPSVVQLTLDLPYNANMALNAIRFLASQISGRIRVDGCAELDQLDFESKRSKRWNNHITFLCAKTVFAVRIIRSCQDFCLFSQLHRLDGEFRRLYGLAFSKSESIWTSRFARVELRTDRLFLSLLSESPRSTEQLFTLYSIGNAKCRYKEAFGEEVLVQQLCSVNIVLQKRRHKRF